MTSTGDKVVILGGRGMLGSDIANECKVRGVSFVALDLPEFDITNEQHLRAAVKDAAVIINCAAYTNVDKAETETGLAFRVNAEAVGQLGILARKSGPWVLHISTDFVFDGNNDKPYVETDMSNPINAYGMSKLAGEKLLTESRCRHCIIRLEWTYGRHGDNFVAKLVNRAKEQKQVKVVDDQVGSPTATTEAAKAICDLLPQRPQGRFHFAADGYTSRFNMAKFIFDKLKMPVEVIACKTADFAGPAKRPLNSRFNCSKIRRLLDRSITRWQVPLEDFLRQL